MSAGDAPCVRQIWTRLSLGMAISVFLKSLSKDLAKNARLLVGVVLERQPSQVYDAHARTKRGRIV